MSPLPGTMSRMQAELDVLGRVTTVLTDLGVPLMLTGSFALAHYANPRMTRDLDIVVQLPTVHVDALLASLGPDFYADGDAARDAIATERLFNILHIPTGIKVDFIIRKSSEYRVTEFERRRPAMLGHVRTWIASREDLILSKLVWSLESQSEMQRRDVVELLKGPIEVDYLQHWAGILGVSGTLNELPP